MLQKLLIFFYTMYILGSAAFAETLTIATVQNDNMEIMKELSSDFIKKNPEITLEWVTFTENILRERVSQDIKNDSGQYDVMTIGLYEVPIWAKQNKLLPLNDLPNHYDYDDILPPIRNGLTFNHQLFAAPFYGESSMVIYRTDLFSKVGLIMPEEPTWAFIKKAAATLSAKYDDIYGICLRGKAGWGENMALLTAMSNSFGAKWFDENWQPQLTSKAWQNTLLFYITLLQNFGPPDAVNNGFNENLALFKAGKCGIWIDATVAAAIVEHDTQSQVTGNVGYALAPHNRLGKKSNWLWAWSLAIPKSTQHSNSAKKFVSWATSKEYLNLVRKRKGVEHIPPGTRKSLYENSDYLKASSFAKITLESINSADPNNPTIHSVPYKGVQYVAIPEFQKIGTDVGRQLSVVLAGHMSVEEGLERAQWLVEEALGQRHQQQ